MVDFNRPELGASFDNPQLPGPVTAAPGRVGPRPLSRCSVPKGPGDEDFNYLDEAYDEDAYAAGLSRFGGGHVEPLGRYDGRETGAGPDPGEVCPVHADRSRVSVPGIDDGRGRSEDGGPIRPPGRPVTSDPADHPRRYADAEDLPLLPGPAPTELQEPERLLSAGDLEAIRWRLDGGTLREVADDQDAVRELGVRLDEPLGQDQDDVTRSGLLSVRAEVYRLLGELSMAVAASRLALAHAESAGDLHAIVIAQAELAHVLRLRGDFA